MLYNIILTMLCWYDIMLTRFLFLAIMSAAHQDPVFWPGSSGIKSSTDQDPVLYNIMLSRFFSYKVSS